MASQVGRLIPDQNLNVHSKGASVVGKGDVSKTQRQWELGRRRPLGDLSNSGKPALIQASKKPSSKNFGTGASIVGKGDAFKTQMKGPGARKPLGDVSNSGKPALTQASKRQPYKNLALVEDVANAPKIIHDGRTKKGVSKALDKVQTRSRKVLSDISNSVKPPLQEKDSTKQKVVAEELVCPSAISQEGFMHNHEECIKAENNAMEIDQFLMKARESMPKSPLRYQNSEEMSDKLDSPPPAFESPKYYTPCEDFDKLSDEADYSPNHYTDSPWIWKEPDFKLM